jgi:outer membrane biosynthesis protein TonB
VKSQPSYRPEPSEAEKKKEDAPAIKSRPSFRAEKAQPNPRETNAPKPAPTPSKLDSIFRSLDRERKAPQQADADRTARDQRRGAPEHRPGAPLSVSEIDAIKRQIRPCWLADAAAKDLESLVVVIDVTMNEDGTVREARIAPETRIRNASHRAAADRALRAVLNERCQPFRLPPEKYARWRQMKLEFDPSD